MSSIQPAANTGTTPRATASRSANQSAQLDFNIDRMPIPIKPLPPPPLELLKQPAAGALTAKPSIARRVCNAILSLLRTARDLIKRLLTTDKTRLIKSLKEQEIEILGRVEASTNILELKRARLGMVEFQDDFLKFPEGRLMYMSISRAVQSKCQLFEDAMASSEYEKQVKPKELK